MDDKRSLFKKNGYVIFENLVPKNKINNLLKIFDKFKKSNSLFYSQSEHNWRLTKDDIDEFNNLNTSIENFTDLIWAQPLSRAGREILNSQKIADCLSYLSEKTKFVMWQNMLFDKSTGTVDHLDSYYLDTEPMGNLIAAWIALENIDGKGGEFHVYEGSHKCDDKSWIGLDHEEFVSWSLNVCKKYKKIPLRIKKGDVVFWHPYLLHGSSSQREKSFTRKSLTAHYHPIDFLMSKGKLNLTNKKDYSQRLKKQFSRSRSFGYPIASRYSRRRIAKFSLKGLLVFLQDKKNNPFMLMNRLKNQAYRD